MDDFDRSNQTVRLCDGRKLGFPAMSPIRDEGNVFGGASGRYLKPCSDEVLKNPASG